MLNSITFLLLVELFERRLELVDLRADLVWELEEGGVVRDGEDQDVVGREAALGQRKFKINKFKYLI